MNTRALRVLTASTLATAAAGIALPAPGNAKVSCDGRVQVSSVDLIGLPADPQAGSAYAVTVDLPRKHPVNPRALLIGVLCGGDGLEVGERYLRGADTLQFRGVPTGPAGDSFEVRFPSPGRWRLASMDVSGSFRDHGFVSVRSPSSAPVDKGGAAGAPLVIAAALLVSAGLALALRRRGRGRDAT
jgi:hypothetical protein